MPVVVRRPVSVTRHTILRPASLAANHPLRGIFFPLGAAFLSNASYPQTLSILNQTNVTVEPFALAGAREMYRYNSTSGAIDASPPTTPQFLSAVSAEIPRYVSLWNARFKNISVTNYKASFLYYVVQTR